MVAPTAAQIREWSKVDFGALDYADDPALERLITQAAAAFRRITGVSLTTVAAEDEPLVNQIIQGLTEQLAYQSQPDIIETLSDFELLSSFSAGAYSESRRSLDELRKAKMVNPWPWLNSALYGFMTPEQLAWWEDFFSDANAPAFAVTEMFWDPYSVEDPWVWGA